MDERSIVTSSATHLTVERLREEMKRVRSKLAEAEADLAREQAAINAFRMHCRLKLDDLIERYLELRSEREGLRVELELSQQADDPGSFQWGEPLSGDFWAQDSDEGEELLLPTQTPRDKTAEKRLFRELARRFHPDLAVSAFERSYRTTIMAAINTAYSEGDIQTLVDLAGELSPQELEEIAGITNSEQRKLVRSIKLMRRLRSKARRQLVVLRQENTAKMWQRANSLGEHDEDGWSLVRNELQEAIDRYELQISGLRKQFENVRGDHEEV